MGSDFRILGELAVYRDGKSVDLGSPRQRATLARFLISRGEVVSTDRLLDDLWAGEVPDGARRTLHVYLSGLRKALGRDSARLQRRGPGYRFVVETHELDASRFEQLASEGRAAAGRNDPDRASGLFSEALGMWKGSALAQFADEPFAREEAVRLERLRLSTVEQRLWVELERGHHAEIVAELGELVARHPMREDFWEQLMLALYRCGRQADALRSFQAARSQLAKELGIEPGPALRDMEERILAQDPTLQRGSGTISVVSSNEMPLPRTSFIGRARELAHGRELLRTSRLLTITGAPGAGKTRLAIRLALDVRNDYSHGAVFIPLASVTNPRLMARAVAGALGLKEVPRETALDSIKAFLRDRQMLVILDNFEQVLQAASDVGELVDAAPDLTIIVTSRAPLGIAGEQRFPVPPLSVPPIDPLPDLEDLVRYDAVALFSTRSREADPAFGLNLENARAVAELAGRLDGLPLAIELAAARSGLFTPRELLDHLEQRPIVLTGAPLDVGSRHRTMHDAIAWSYELLGLDEQVLFRRLGVFRGGFTLDAASAVAGVSDREIFTGAESLLSKSLLYRTVDQGRARFAMLEMMREFALGELVAAGEEREFSARHAAHFLRLVAKIEPQLTHDPGGPGSQQLEAEVENLRAALSHALEAPDPDLGLNLAGCVWRFWQSSNRLTEGREWLVSLLSLPSASDEARARGLSALAGMAYWQADYDEALAVYELALEMYRGNGDRANVADTLFAMSATANWAGDLDAGERLALESRMMFEELGSREGLGKALTAQGFSLWKRGDFAAACKHYEDAAAIAREFDDPVMAATLLIGVAALRYLLGELQDGFRVALIAVDESFERGNAHIAVWALDLAASISATVAPEAAVRLAAGADSLRTEAGGGMLQESFGIKDARSAAASLLDPNQLRQEWERGRNATLDEAVALAHELEALVSGHPASQGRTNSSLTKH